MSDPRAILQPFLDETRRRHEQLIAGLVLLTCVLSLAPTSWRAMAADRAVATSALFTVSGVGLYYAWVLLRASKSSTGRIGQYLQVTLEVSLASVLIIVESALSAEHAMTSASTYLYPLAVALSGLRLRPVLCLYAGALAAVQVLAIYNILAAQAPLDLSSLTAVSLVHRALLFSLVGAVGAVVAAALNRLIAQVLEEAERRNQVRAAFGTYVADQVVERALAGDLVPAVERREISVLFTDIRGFTRLSEGMEPDVLVARLNTALGAFSEAVHGEGGIVNKFLGDGLMAIFGAPRLQEDHADHAVLAALAILDAAEALRWSGQFPDLEVGVGIHSGTVVVGDVGGEGRREYTAIGDVVNVASRVEAKNKDLGTGALITAATHERLNIEVILREVGLVALRNREERVVVFELQAAEGVDEVI